MRPMTAQVNNRMGNMDGTMESDMDEIGTEDSKYNLSDGGEEYGNGEDENDENDYQRKGNEEHLNSDDEKEIEEGIPRRHRCRQKHLRDDVHVGEGALRLYGKH